MMAKNFPELMKDIKYRFSKFYELSRRNVNKIMPECIRVKNAKAKAKEKKLKMIREKRHISFKEGIVKIVAKFSTEIMEASK